MTRHDQGVSALGLAEMVPVLSEAREPVPTRGRYHPPVLPDGCLHAPTCAHCPFPDCVWPTGVINGRNPKGLRQARRREEGRA